MLGASGLLRRVLTIVLQQGSTKVASRRKFGIMPIPWGLAAPNLVKGKNPEWVLAARSSGLILKILVIVTRSSGLLLGISHPTHAQTLDACRLRLGGNRQDQEWERVCTAE